VIATACERGGPEVGFGRRLTPVYGPKSGRLEELRYDANNDGRPDIIGFMDGSQLLRVEVDENGDGKPDRWEYYTAPSPPSAAEPTSPRALPMLERVEEDSHFDGRISRREFYEHGQLARVEEDADGDGRADRWETHEGGVMKTMDLDLDHDGRADRRLMYSSDGNSVRTEHLSDPGPR